MRERYHEHTHTQIISLNQSPIATKKHINKDIQTATPPQIKLYKKVIKTKRKAKKITQIKC